MKVFEPCAGLLFSETSERGTTNSRIPENVLKASFQQSYFVTAVVYLSNIHNQLEVFWIDFWNIYHHLLFSIRPIETCSGCNKTGHFPPLKGLPKIIFHFGCYFKNLFGFLSELILLKRSISFLYV